MTNLYFRKEHNKKMNKVFLIGKVVDSIEFKFIINSDDVSVVNFELLIIDKQRIKVKGYNEMADFIYRNIKKGNKIAIQGKFKNQYVEIEEINFISNK